MISLPIVAEGAAAPAATVPLTDTPWIGPHGRLMERLELHITYTCPERCVFCSEEHRMQAYKPYQVTFGRVATVLREHALRGVCMGVFDRYAELFPVSALRPEREERS